MCKHLNNNILYGGYLNSYLDKEQTEWSNFWYDKANTISSRRILFIGDSVARQVRRTMSEMLGCPVDLFATSAALRDQMFWDQWECFFKSGLYSYDAIFVWIGNHSRMSENGESLFQELDYARFKRDFHYLIDQCEKYSSKIVILTTLHMFKWRKYNSDIERIRRKLMIKPKEFLNDEENVVVEGKNIIMREIANEKGLSFYDIDESLMSSKYWHVDFIHYIPESNKYVCSILKSLLHIHDNYDERNFKKSSVGR